MKKPEITLKNFKLSSSVANDSTCYSADVFINGVKAFHSQNDGWGGPDVHTPYGDKGKVLMEEAKEYYASLPEEIDTSLGLDVAIQPSLEIAVAELAAQKELEHNLRKEANSVLRNVIFMDKGAVRAFKGKYTKGMDLDNHYNKLKETLNTDNPVILQGLKDKDGQKILMARFNGHLSQDEVNEVIIEVLRENQFSDEDIEQALDIELTEGLSPR
jgi:polyhydroxyalkanoate synthesis regulator phasin